MRSSKSRSRNKNNNNRNRHSGNNLNRVFDSSGPEGKVRGTPQQIIEKYSQLARDATLGNDRVAAENFQQHSEHYTRVNAEAQKETEAKREAHEREQRERQQARADQPRHNDQQQVRDQSHSDRPQDQPKPGNQPANDLANSEQPDIGSTPAQSAESGLVETPEQSAPKRKPRTRKPKIDPTASDQPETPKAAE